MPKSKVTIHCLDCPFYSGVQCHGHGEYWGHCSKIEEAYKILEMRIDDDHYITSGMRDICFDDSECKFLAWRMFEIKSFGKGK